MQTTFEEKRSIPLTRKEAETYLLENHGRAGAVTAKTLAKLATLGGGPIFHRVGRRVAYLPGDLDTWVQARSSGPMKSTSDIGATGSNDGQGAR